MIFHWQLELHVLGQTNILDSILQSIVTQVSTSGIVQLYMEQLGPVNPSLHSHMQANWLKTWVRNGQGENWQLIIEAVVNGKSVVKIKVGVAGEPIEVEINFVFVKFIVKDVFVIAVKVSVLLILDAVIEDLSVVKIVEKLQLAHVFGHLLANVELLQSI